jgi:hypothetical protein
MTMSVSMEDSLAHPTIPCIQLQPLDEQQQMALAINALRKGLTMTSFTSSRPRAATMDRNSLGTKSAILFRLAPNMPALLAPAVLALASVRAWCAASEMLEFVTALCISHSPCTCCQPNGDGYMHGRWSQLVLLKSARLPIPSLDDWAMGGASTAGLSGWWEAVEASKARKMWRESLLSSCVEGVPVGATGLAYVGVEMLFCKQCGSQCCGSCSA